MQLKHFLEEVKILSAKCLSSPILGNQAATDNYKANKNQVTNYHFIKLALLIQVAVHSRTESD